MYSNTMMKNSKTSKLSSEDYHQLNQQRNKERKGSKNEGNNKKIRERGRERERMNEWKTCIQFQ